MVVQWGRVAVDKVCWMKGDGVHSMRSARLTQRKNNTVSCSVGVRAGSVSRRPRLVNTVQRRCQDVQIIRARTFLIVII